MKYQDDDKNIHDNVTLVAALREHFSDPIVELQGKTLFLTVTTRDTKKIKSAKVKKGFSSYMSWYIKAFTKLTDLHNSKD